MLVVNCFSGASADVWLDDGLEACLDALRDGSADVDGVGVSGRGVGDATADGCDDGRRSGDDEGSGEGSGDCSGSGDDDRRDDRSDDLNDDRSDDHIDGVAIAVDGAANRAADGGERAAGSPKAVVWAAWAATALRLRATFCMLIKSSRRSALRDVDGIGDASVCVCTCACDGPGKGGVAGEAH